MTDAIDRRVRPWMPAGPGLPPTASPRALPAIRRHLTRRELDELLVASQFDLSLRQEHDARCLVIGCAGIRFSASLFGAERDSNGRYHGLRLMAWTQVPRAQARDLAFELRHYLREADIGVDKDGDFVIKQVVDLTAGWTLDELRLLIESWADIVLDWPATVARLVA